MLIAFSGLPGTGKTSIARELARRLGAVYLRADTIEQALRGSGRVLDPLNDAGYRVAYAVAEENLRLGRTVVADSVNPFVITRDAWRDVAVRAGTPLAEIEVICSDPDEHRRRVEARDSEIAGLRLPDWDAVLAREYHAWNRDRILIDTAGQRAAACVDRIVEYLGCGHGIKKEGGL